MGRTLTYQYGSATNTPEFVQGRITQLIDSEAGTLAGYAYGASQRLVRESRGGPVGSSILDYSLLGGSTTGYDTMDRFGRVRSHSWLDSAGGVNELLGIELDFDALGNKRFARVRQLGHDNDRSYLFGYDDLQQLTFAELGRLNNENSSIVPDPLVTLRRRSRWALDNLSNWRGGVQNGTQMPGSLREDFKLGNTSVEAPDISRALTHGVDSANQITSAATATNSAAGTENASRSYRYDRAGNLVFDGDLVYFYDGLNHLIGVYERGPTTIAHFDANGVWNGPGLGPPAALFAYDGLGRLIKKQYRVGVAGEIVPLGFAHYIYDGARRVQEVLRFPVVAVVTAMFAAQAGAALPPAYVHTECNAGGNCPPGYSSQYVIEHEYVWSPDGGDSIVAAITPDDLYGFDDDGPPAGAGLPSVAGSGDDDVYYMLQDDNGNVMSVVDDAGAVRVQYQYDPYGELVIRDVPLPGSLPLPGPTAKSPLFSVGFQGLFFERFYGLLVESAGGGQRSNVTDPPLYVPAPVSAAGGNGGAGGVGSASGSTQVREFYYVRNRCNCPRDARFTTRDPNDAGFPIISRLSSNGDVVWYGAGPFSADGHYGDGMNLYGFLGGNPANLRDPLGLDILDDEGISADVQSWGLATSQLSVAAGTAFSFADVGTLIASGFLSLTSGSGRTWVDNMSDCVKRLGPVHSNNTIVWSVATAAKLAVTSFTPVPKWALVYGKDSDGAASTGPWGLPSSRIA